MNSPDHGRFCWHDLMSTDPDASLAFYGELFGWTLKSFDAAPDHGYSMLCAGEHPIGGIVPLDPEQGIPSHWMPYIAVDAIEDACTRVAELGGGVCVPPTDVGPGIFAVVNDPQGGFFSVWQSKDTSRPEPDKGTPGVFCWHECMSTDADATAAYYTDLFGWRLELQQMNLGGVDMAYRLFHLGDEHHGGALDLPAPAIEQGARTHWLCYVNVDDVDVSAERTVALGGAVLCPCTDIPDTGRFCVIQDPQGGMIALFTHAEGKA